MSGQLADFFGPGPTWVRPEILAEMTRPMLGHRSSEFRELCHSLFADVKTLFGTSAHGFVATCSGSGLLEGALLNCVPRRILVTTCGAFSERWMKMAEQLGLEVEQLHHEWGQPVDPERLASHFAGRRYHYDAVAFTHNETSTGVLNDLQTLAQVVRDESRESLILVDAVSSLGGAPLKFDEWGLDVCLASTQKGLALPPGVTVFAVSKRAMEAAAKKKYRGSYFDFLDFKKHADNDGTPFTPSIPHFYALAKQLHHILREEGLEARWERHLTMRELTFDRTASHSRPAVNREIASLTVSALTPLRTTPAELLRGMKARGLTLGSGYGVWKESTYRIGHMGDISIEALTSMLDVLDEVAG